MIGRYSIVLAVVLLSFLHARALQIGEIYSGPEKLSAPNLGASLMLPGGWNAQLQDPKGPLILQSQTDSSRIMVEANVSVYGNPADMLREKMVYYGLDLFSPSQIKQMRPSMMYRLYRVEGSETFSQALVYLILGTQKRAVLLYGFFDPEHYASMRQTMLTLADSLGFTTIRNLPKHLSSRHMQLSGGHYVFYERRGSFSEKRELWLCGDGTAVLKGTYAAANDTTRTAIVRRGSWHLEQEWLRIVLQDGTQERYRVLQENNTLYFDKAQTFRLPNHLCR